MKRFKGGVFILFFIATLSLYSQVEQEQPKDSLKLSKWSHSELKIGAIKLIATPALDIEYERYLGNNFSTGVGFIYKQSSFTSLTPDVAVLPFIRTYFSKLKENQGYKGFFIQIEIGYVSYQTETFSYASNQASYQYFNHNTLGVGIGLGYKWKAPNGIVVGITPGILRPFNNNSRVLFNGGIYLGYNFKKKN